ncbi:MAG: hypothetical protein J5510_05445 [Prevotella sp.]|nr:hypothetical protein [Prevotella sp.]
MAFTDEEKAEILAIVQEQTVTPSDISTATSLDAISSLPGVDAGGGYKMLPMSLIKNRHVTLTQDEYDAIVAAETVNEDTFYYIKEETEEEEEESSE